MNPRTPVVRTHSTEGYQYVGFKAPTDVPPRPDNVQNNLPPNRPPPPAPAISTVRSRAAKIEQLDHSIGVPKPQRLRIDLEAVEKVRVAQRIQTAREAGALPSSTPGDANVIANSGSNSARSGKKAGKFTRGQTERRKDRRGTVDLTTSGLTDSKELAGGKSMRKTFLNLGKSDEDLTSTQYGDGQFVADSPRFRTKFSIQDASTQDQSGPTSPESADTASPGRRSSRRYSINKFGSPFRKIVKNPLALSDQHRTPRDERIAAPVSSPIMVTKKKFGIPDGPTVQWEPEMQQGDELFKSPSVPALNSPQSPVLPAPEQVASARIVLQPEVEEEKQTVGSSATQPEQKPVISPRQPGPQSRRVSLKLKSPLVAKGNQDTTIHSPRPEVMSSGAVTVVPNSATALAQEVAGILQYYYSDTETDHEAVAKEIIDVVTRSMTAASSPSDTKEVKEQ